MADIGKPIRRIRVEPERVAPAPAPAERPERKEPAPTEEKATEPA